MQFLGAERKEQEREEEERAVTTIVRGPDLPLSN
jgi:hypothetical protein